MTTATTDLKLDKIFDPRRWEFIGSVLVTTEYIFARDRTFQDMDCPAGCEFVVGVCSQNETVIGIEVNCDCEFTREHIDKLEDQLTREATRADEERNRFN